MKIRRILSCLLVMTLMLLSALPVAAEDRILRRGDTGDDVLLVQRRLFELNYLQKEPDSVFDEETESAILLFQEQNQLMATGMVDRVTRDKLFSDSALAFSPSLSNAPDLFEEMFALAEYPAAASSAMPSVNLMSGLSFKSPASWNTNEYPFFQESGFQAAGSSPLSTFAADVDTASYAQLRSMILSGRSVSPDAVRVEEMLNYFHYSYPAPEGDHPFGVAMELAPCPWNADTLLLQIGLQANEITRENRPRHNLVFLIDVSGSMFGSDRLDLVKRAFLLLLEELEPTDTVSIVTYASSDEVVLSGVPAADQVRIMEAISGLSAHGSTNSAAGIQTAYQLAEAYATEDSINRILMATDGDFNVGITSEGDLARLVMEKKESGVRLTMLGVGYGNYKDNKLEALADYGDGNYYYLDSIFEARRALVTEAGGTLMEIARDVKLQVDFNPAKISAYRLIGYEDRQLEAADFADDSKDGGEIGSGHRVTALYEIVPAGSGLQLNLPASKYQQASSDSISDEWLTLSIRYKKPGQDSSELETYPLIGEAEDTLSDNMKFAASVAETAMLLRGSEFKGDATYTSALSLARDCPDVTGDPYKEEFVYLLTLLERSESMP